MLHAVHQQTGMELFPTDPLCDLTSSRVPARNDIGSSLEAVPAQAGCVAWPPPGLDDQPESALLRYPPSVGPQNANYSPAPEDIGQGEIEDGRRGDPTKPPVPNLPDDLTQPRDGDMVSDPNAQPLPDGSEVALPNVVADGLHYRAILNLKHAGGVTLTRARILSGALPDAWPDGQVDKGALLGVVYGVNPAGGAPLILSISTHADPFEIWGHRYLAVFTITDGLTFLKVNKDEVPGWQFGPRDTFYAANLDGDDKEDLLARNSQDWSKAYVGRFHSNGDGGFSANWQEDALANLDLKTSFTIRVGNFWGQNGYDDFFAINGNYLWMARNTGSGFQIQAYYPGWIHNHRFHSLGYW